MVAFTQLDAGQTYHGSAGPHLATLSILLDLGTDTTELENAQVATLDYTPTMREEYITTVRYSS